MTSGCLDRKEVRGAIWGVHSTTDRPASGNTGRLFLAFGGPVCADRISNCPLDRVLTYKNLIYLLNLQIAIFMNDLASEIKNLGLGIRVGDHDPFHTSIMHKIKTKQVTGVVVAVEKVA